MSKKTLDKKWMFFVISILFCACMFAGILPVSAVPPNTVLDLQLGATQTVFLGEKNVPVLSPAYPLPTDVAFFTYDPKVPAAVVKLGNPDNFDTGTHQEFNSGTIGQWYFWDGVTQTRGPEAFNLVQPNMSILVRDYNQGNNQDRTGTSVMNSQILAFRASIDKNVIARNVNQPNPPNLADIVYDINLIDSKFTYPVLNNNALGLLKLIERGSIKTNQGGLTKINNPDIAGPWYLNALDGNGQYITPLGQYWFNATCQINGLTVASPKNEVTLVKPSVSVSVSPASVQRGVETTVTINGEPGKEYYFGIIECPLRMTGAICDRPPWIEKDSSINGSLEFTMTGDETLVPSCCGGLPFKDVVPPNPPLNDGNYRYAKVITDNFGVASFLIGSDENTWKANDDATYTLHVQKVKPEIDGTTLYAQTTLTLTKGTITLQFYDESDPAQTPINEAFLGDRIGIKGTNTETAHTYLYMTGPCQPECGGSLLPTPYPYGLLGPGPDQIDVIGGNWQFVTPNIAGQTWWDTSVLPINPGTYTIYALSNWPKGCPSCVTCGGGKCELLNCPNCLIYAVGTITLKEPTLNATVTDVERCCCPGYPCGTTIDGQPITVVGNSTGNTPYVDLRKDPQSRPLISKDVNVWLFGQGKVGDRKFLNWRQSIPCDGEFNFTIPLSKWNLTLCTLDAGDYDLIIQTKGYNQQYDVLYEDDILGTIKSGGVPVEQNKRWIVTSYPVNALHDLVNNEYPDYAKLVQVEGPGYKLGTEAMNELLRGLDNPNIDDKYVHVKFNIKSKSCLGGTDFDVDRTYGNSPLPVRFTDKTSDSPTSWSWDFGDGNTSTLQNPNHTYYGEKRYTVSLITNGDASKKQVKNDLIHVTEGPKADFTKTPADVVVGNQVQFMDLSAGSPSSWSWDFGDGTTSSLQSPVHTYERAGSHTVKLTVGDSTGVSQTVAKVVVVSGAETPVVAAFSTSMLGSAIVQFTDQSTGYGIVSWIWNFDDGTTSTEKNPKHTYDKEGTYSVNLSVSNGEYSNSIVKTIGIS